MHIAWHKIVAALLFILLLRLTVIGGHDGDYASCVFSTHLPQHLLARHQPVHQMVAIDIVHHEQ